jgi:AraC-like DNA-binding protein
MKEPPYLVRFASGIPTYTSRYGRYVWMPGTPPALLLHNDWDVFWVKQGAAKWEFRDGRTVTAGVDEFAILPPFVPAVITETKAQLVFQYCHFSLRVVPDYLPPKLKEHFQGPGKAALLPLSFSKREAPEIHRAYANIDRINENLDRAPWRLESATIELVSALTDYGLRRTEKGAPGILIEPVEHPDTRVARLCRMIDADPVKPWRVTEMASSVGLSGGRLHSLFRRVMGHSVKGYIVRARLHRALHLLREQPEGRLPSIKEVSGKCGFTSQHFFSRQFKAHFRITPLQYRSGAALA